ncbi:MAG: CoA transferase [Salinarimonadaceae bacterium]|nr:MAG: CoA transferase [Salinarimonadaceae bacterium]
MLSAGLARTSEGRRGSRLRAAPAAARPTAARPVVAASPDEDRRPLAGLRVLDLTRMLAGPTTGLLLADMGAEVIKIEEPQIGDPTRRNVPHLGGESTYYMAVNRGKLGITLDLKSPEGRAALLDLVAKSDIIVENFRAGVMDRLGLGFDVLREVRKDIVLCSISGFGASGPLRDKTSFDLVNQAMAGTMSVTGEVGRPPARIGVPAGDLCGGYFGCLAILAALRARRKTGRGAHIDLSLHDCLISLLGYLGQAYFTTGESLGPVGSGHHHIVPYGAFDASDGTLVIAAFSQNFWERFAGAIGRPDLLSDARFETLERRKTNREPLMAILRPILSSGTRDYWIATLGEHDVPCATIASVGEALESDQAVARGLVFEVAHSSLGALKALATPLRADGAPWLSALPPPMLGEHTRQVLAGLLGYSEEDIARHLSIQKRPKVGRGADASLATGRTS